MMDRASGFKPEATAHGMKKIYCLATRGRQKEKKKKGKRRSYPYKLVPWLLYVYSNRIYLDPCCYHYVIPELENQLMLTGRKLKYQLEELLQIPWLYFSLSIILFYVVSGAFLSLSFSVEGTIIKRSTETRCHKTVVWWHQANSTISSAIHAK